MLQFLYQMTNGPVLMFLVPICNDNTYLIKKLRNLSGLEVSVEDVSEDKQYAFDWISSDEGWEFLKSFQVGFTEKLKKPITEVHLFRNSITNTHANFWCP